MDLFVPQEVRVVDVPLETRLEQSVATLAQLMRDKMPMACAYSGGKGFDGLDGRVVHGGRAGAGRRDSSPDAGASREHRASRIP